MTSLYIDTNILLNLVNEERNPYGKDLSAPASKLFFEAISCKYCLIISSWTVIELMKKAKPEQVSMVFELIKKKLIIVKYGDNDVSNAKLKSQDNFPDALHVVLAEKAKADYIVTRDFDDFLKIGTKIPLRKPEQL